MGIVWTLRARGLAPSLGACGSLVVAAVCCLLLASALITFRGWPGRGEAPGGGTIALTAPAGKAAGRSGAGPSAPAAATVAAPAAARRLASRPARRRAGTRRAPADRPPAPAGTKSPAAPAPAPAAPAAPAAGAPAADPAPVAGKPAVPLPDLPLPAPPSGAVEQTIATVRPRVEAPLPPAVRQPVVPVLDTVQETGRTVDGVSGALLPTLP
jgi:hypothetical protein